MNTHMHADHITGSGVLKNLIPGSQSLISKESNALADVYVSHGDIVEFGGHKIEVRSTPGHTNGIIYVPRPIIIPLNSIIFLFFVGCVSYVVREQGMVFTGDALLIRGCGRTDFQEGNSETLYESVHNQIFSLPENFRLFPGHDYNGKSGDYFGIQKYDFKK